MGNEQSREKSNRRKSSSQGIELQNLSFQQPRDIQSRPGSSQGSGILLPPSLTPQQQKTRANTPKQKLELLRTELKKLDFKYGQGSDCRMLADKTINLAKGNNINATEAKRKEQQKAMLVEKGTIKGDTRQSNTAGVEMWFFQEHFWCEIEGIEYDPLFDKQGTPSMDLESERPSYKDCYISKFDSGRAMVHEASHCEITADTVFQSYEDAKAFVDEKNKDYTSESE